MADWPVGLSSSVGGVISTVRSFMPLITIGIGGTVWPTANKALFHPVKVSHPVMVYKLAAGANVTQTGNYDLGIYDTQGNRLVSTGSTAKVQNVELIVDVTDTYLHPGLYYLAMATNGVTSYVGWTFSGTTPVPVQRARLCGIMEMDSAFPLPATATFAAATHGVGYSIGAYTRPA